MGQQFCTLTRKVLDFQGLFVFLGVKNPPLSPLHLLLNPWLEKKLEKMVLL
jgi:hypothetical protein